jgi:GxxExxY protein
MRLAGESLAETVMDVAGGVHRRLGAGQRSATYRRYLVRDLASAGIDCACDVPLRVTYMGREIDTGTSADLIVNGSLLVVIAGVEHPRPVIDARLRASLRLSRLSQGLLINFNVSALIADGFSSVTASTASAGPDSQDGMDSVAESLAAPLSAAR